jgi:hypothetical protein
MKPIHILRLGDAKKSAVPKRPSRIPPGPLIQLVSDSPLHPFVKGRRRRMSFLLFAIFSSIQKKEISWEGLEKNWSKPNWA